MKIIYVVRHCEAEGQPAEAPLTIKGQQQAIDLVSFFSDTKIERIISSPFKRAIDSIKPLAKQLNINIEINEQLKERVLSTIDEADWFEKFKRTFDDYELKFAGGESNLEAMNRIVHLIENDIKNNETTIIVSHGNLIALLLNYIDKSQSIKSWEKLSNPDVYRIEIDHDYITYERVWQRV